jgi:hypothetical protein
MKWTGTGFRPSLFHVRGCRLIPGNGDKYARLSHECHLTVTRAFGSTYPAEIRVRVSRPDFPTEPPSPGDSLGVIPALGSRQETPSYPRIVSPVTMHLSRAGEDKSGGLSRERHRTATMTIAAVVRPIRRRTQANAECLTSSEFPGGDKFPDSRCDSAGKFRPVLTHRQDANAPSRTRCAHAYVSAVDFRNALPLHT